MATNQVTADDDAIAMSVAREGRVTVSPNGRLAALARECPSRAWRRTDRPRSTSTGSIPSVNSTSA